MKPSNEIRAEDALRFSAECGVMLPLADAARIADSISAARRIECPGTDYNLHAADPCGTLAHVLDFLHSLPPLHHQP